VYFAALSTFFPVRPSLSVFVVCYLQSTGLSEPTVSAVLSLSPASLLTKPLF